jgi:hypothetical protein
LQPNEQPQDNEEESGEDETEDIYVPPAPEPMSRKRSIQEVAGDDEEPGSKKVKA